MPKLKDASVLRAGLTAREWKAETKNVELATSQSRLRMEFEMKSKGGGVTQVQVVIGPQDIPILVDYIVRMDRKTAMEEFSKRLAIEISRQSQHDQELVYEARQSLVDAAEKAYKTAPPAHQATEQFKYQIVKALVENIEKKEKEK